MSEQYECTLCDESFIEYYDCRSHVYMKHKDEPEHCGIPEHAPDWFISHVDVSVK
jgi:hypothetical protein